MTTSKDIHDQLGHPVIDADGHVLEYLPAVEPYLREALGAAAFERYRSQSTPLQRIMDADTDRRLATRTPQSAWWGTPARNVRDLATAAAPALMYERMDELGLDFAVLYPTKGFGIAGIDDDELRQRRVPRVQRVLRRHVRQVRRPADRGRGRPDAHPRGGDRRPRALRAASGSRSSGLPEGVTRPIPEPDGRRRRS